MALPTSPRTNPVVFVDQTDDDTEFVFPLIDLVGEGAQSFDALKIYLAQQAYTIPSEGEGGFGHAILTAICGRNYPALDLIVSHYPAKFQNIPIKEEYGLGQALLLELEHLNLVYQEELDTKIDFQFLFALLNHPQVHLVEDEVPGILGSGDFEDGDIDIEQTEQPMYLEGLLSSLLINVVCCEEVEIAIPIFRSPLMNILSANGSKGLGKLLSYAAFGGGSKAVELVLAVPFAREINSDPISSEMQEAGFASKRYGFTEAIFWAILNNEIDEEETVKMINAIASFAPSLRLEGDLGLIFTLEEAKRREYPKIVSRLESLIEEIEENF